MCVTIRDVIYRLRLRTTFAADAVTIFLSYIRCDIRISWRLLIDTTASVANSWIHMDIGSRRDSVWVCLGPCYQTTCSPVCHTRPCCLLIKIYWKQVFALMFLLLSLLSILAPAQHVVMLTFCIYTQWNMYMLTLCFALLEHNYNSNPILLSYWPYTPGATFTNMG